MGYQTRIFITRAGSISGAGEGLLSTADLMGLSDGRQFVSLEEATTWLPFDLDLTLEFPTGEKRRKSNRNRRKVSLRDLAGVTVCPVQLTDAELAKRADVPKVKHDRHQFHAFIAADQVMDGVAIANPDRYACVSATGGGGLLGHFQSTVTVLTGGRLKPSDNLKFLPNIVGGMIAARYGLRGPSETHATACSASGDALNSLVRMILSGDADGGLLIGTDAAISPIGIGTFFAQGALGDGLSFQNLERRGKGVGFAMGEGAGALLIESEAAMEKAGRKPLAEIVGHGSSSDASRAGAITDPNAEGQSLSAATALARAGVDLDDVSVVSVHGTATGGDVEELKGLGLLKPADLAQVLAVAPKTYFGHLLGAASVLETIAGIGMLRDKRVVPTRALTADNLEPSCATVRHALQPEPLAADALILLNSFGFAGTNASRVIRGVG